MPNQEEKTETYENQYTPAQFDQLFGQIASGTQMAPEATREAWQAYFDLAEQTLRTARRVGEVQVLSFMKHQIVQEVTGQVISAIQQNPSLISSKDQRRS